jgi:hypothetical protein
MHRTGGHGIQAFRRPDRICPAFASGSSRTRIGEVFDLRITGHEDATVENDPLTIESLDSSCESLIIPRSNPLDSKQGKTTWTRSTPQSGRTE